MSMAIFGISLRSRYNIELKQREFASMKLQEAIEEKGEFSHLAGVWRNEVDKHKYALYILDDVVKSISDDLNSEDKYDFFRTFLTNDNNEKVG